MDAAELVILLMLLNPFIGFWVYFDATKNRIGKIKGSKSSLNMSALGWSGISVFAVGLWLIYLLSRPKLISLAKENPSDTGRVKSEIYLLLIGYIVQFVALGYVNYLIVLGK